MGRKRTAAMRSLPPNLYLNAAGYFYYRNPEKKTTKGLGRDRMSAMAHARAANATLAARAPSFLVDWVAGRVDYTLAEWLPLYRELWAQKEVRAENTLRGCKMYLAKLEASEFAGVKLREITTAHVAKLLEAAEKQSGAATAIALRARTSDVFRMAMTQGLIEDGKNPVTSTYTPDRTVMRERMTLEQFNAIKEKAPGWLQRAMMIALLTAQRREDVSDMKFTDVRDGFLYVVQGKSQGEIKLQIDTQTRLDAVGISITDAIQACRDKVVSRFIVHHSVHQGAAKPGAKVAANGLTMAFAAARDAAGVTARDGKTPPTFHEIRSLAQRLYRKEYGAEFAQAMLGHKNASMTAVYNDLRGSDFQLVRAK